jgi:3-phenylpropionate/cinnamic acid dioxygenase small subunit
MKTYKQLPIPEDTAWERKTLFGMLHWRIRNFLTSCNNLIKWFPTIWYDRDWDGHFILKILQKKIEFQRKELVNANRHTRIESDNRDMTLALNLLERVKEEYYNLECMDYWDNDMIFNDVPDNPKLKSIDFEEKWEKYDEFLTKYPSSVRAVVKEHGEQDDKKRLCLLVSHYNHNKANKRLFRILGERLAYWWD